MPAVIVAAEERSVFSPNAPTALEIERALAPLATDGGSWLGPHARITRGAPMGERFPTRVAWVYAWPVSVAADLERAPVAALQARVVAALDNIARGWQGVRVTPYAPAVNGSLEWWSSGTAANTQTRHTFPTGAGRLAPDENPIGPTTPETHVPTPGEILSGAGAGASDVFTPLAWCIGLGSLVYFGAPLLSMFRTRRRSRAA